MNPDIKLKDYLQLGNHESKNTFIGDEDGDEVEAISLNEFNDESKPGSGTDRVITGIEEFRARVLSRQTAQFFNLKNAEGYAKKATEMNFVMGNEGFISSMMEGIKSIIEKIVKFIMGGVNWLIEAGKSLLGLSANAERKEKQAKDTIHAYKDMENYLRSKGFPESVLSLENCVKHLSPDYKKAFELIQCDQIAAKGHFDNLFATSSALNVLQKDLSKHSIFVAKTQTKIKERIESLYDDLVKDKGDATSHRYLDLAASINEAITELNFTQFESRLTAIIDRHYKKVGDKVNEIQNPEFAATVNRMRLYVNSIKEKMNRARPDQLIEGALVEMDKLAAVRGNPSRQIIPAQTFIDYRKFNNVASAKLQYIETSFFEKSSYLTHQFVAYLAETAKYVTLSGEINLLIKQCINEQLVYFNFFTRLSYDMTIFFEKGMEAFVTHLTAINSNLAEKDRFVSMGKKIFESDEVADSWTSQINQTLETLHKNGDLLNVQSRIKAFKLQMGG
ncbi:virion structural protein [Shewanella phage FishSpeaker]|nr:virion structural protein [Shewanella phage FishSpeaker]